MAALIQVVESMTATWDPLVGKKPPTGSELEGFPSSPHNLPKLRDLRKAIKVEAEREYFQILLILTNGVTEEACRIAGLSTARFYALRKKYWRSTTTPKIMCKKFCKKR
jgi:hypothetical protein